MNNKDLEQKITREKYSPQFKDEENSFLKKAAAYFAKESK